MLFLTIFELALFSRRPQAPGGQGPLRVMPVPPSPPLLSSAAGASVPVTGLCGEATGPGLAVEGSCGLTPEPSKGFYLSPSFCDQPGSRFLWKSDNLRVVSAKRVWLPVRLGSHTATCCFPRQAPAPGRGSPRRWSARPAAGRPQSQRWVDGRPPCPWVGRPARIPLRVLGHPLGGVGAWLRSLELTRLALPHSSPCPLASALGWGSLPRGLCSCEFVRFLLGGRSPEPLARPWDLTRLLKARFLLLSMPDPSGSPWTGVVTPLSRRDT